MSTNQKTRRARLVLGLLLLLGMSLLAIPFFLTPPAFLELVLRDGVFASNLGGKSLRVTNQSSGAARSMTVGKEGGGFLARVGRIASGSTSFTVDLSGYKPAMVAVEAAPLATVRRQVDLEPTFGRVEVLVVDATESDRPVSGSLREGRAPLATEPRSVHVVELAPGQHRLAAEADGYCPGERDVKVREGETVRLKMPLSPALTGNEVARLILNWGDNPRDLDAHLRRVGTSGFPNPEHVYFSHMEGRTELNQRFAQLDVDHQNSESYETVTVYDTADGDYEYWVDRYAGEGTLGGSGAEVEAFSRGCERLEYRVPADCSERVWEVTHLRISQGRVELLEQNDCIPGVDLRVGGKAPLGGR